MNAESIALVRELAGTDCRCGALKDPKKTFCSRCYFRLPKAMRQALYNRVSEGYEEAYAAALAELVKQGRVHA